MGVSLWGLIGVWFCVLLFGFDCLFVGLCLIVLALFDLRIGLGLVLYGCIGLRVDRVKFGYVGYLFDADLLGW